MLSSDLANIGLEGLFEGIAWRYRLAVSLGGIKNTPYCLRNRA
jgi:hypothetical protein